MLSYGFYLLFAVFQPSETSPDSCFIKISDHTLVSSGRITYTYVMTEECLLKCLQATDFTCRSVSYYRDRGTCVLNSRDKLEDPLSFVSTLGQRDHVDYHQRTCFGEVGEKKLRCFVVFPGRTLVGIADYAFQNVASEFLCQKRCSEWQSSTGVRCKAAIYFALEKECIISSHDRNDLPELFVPDRRALYMENHCSPSPPLDILKYSDDTSSTLQKITTKAPHFFDSLAMMKNDETSENLQDNESMLLPTASAKHSSSAYNAFVDQFVEELKTNSRTLKFLIKQLIRHRYEELTQICQSVVFAADESNNKSQQTANGHRLSRIDDKETANNENVSQGKENKGFNQSNQYSDKKTVKNEDNHKSSKVGQGSPPGVQPPDEDFILTPDVHVKLAYAIDGEPSSKIRESSTGNLVDESRNDESLNTLSSGDAPKNPFDTEKSDLPKDSSLELYEDMKANIDENIAKSLKQASHEKSGYTSEDMEDDSDLLELRGPSPPTRSKSLLNDKYGENARTGTSRAVFMPNSHSDVTLCFRRIYVTTPSFLHYIKEPSVLDCAEYCRSCKHCLRMRPCNSFGYSWSEKQCALTSNPLVESDSSDVMSTDYVFYKRISEC
ncbi:hypothetical protein AB6A40_002503 [Gnathostoma spinigerum]|uniref:Apple domain-containing protein n=1 Tax=Gnathostoma spinigerum TaxID=75299 RepID=A0ABD6E6S0_9BILA